VTDTLHVVIVWTKTRGRLVDLYAALSNGIGIEKCFVPRPIYFFDVCKFVALE